MNGNVVGILFGSMVSMIRMVASLVNTASKEPAMRTQPSAFAIPTTAITGYQVWMILIKLDATINFFR